MKLSMKFLYLKLSERIEGLKLYTKGQENPLTDMVRIGLGQERDSVSENLLYVFVGKKRGGDFPENIPVVLPEGAEFCRENPRLTVPAGRDMYEVFNLLLSVFQKYQTWEDQVKEAVLEKQDLQKILDLTAPIIGNPMYIADLSFKMLAWINMDLDEISVIWRYQIRYGYLPYDIMLNLVRTGELELLNRTEDAFYIDSKSFLHPFISKTIRYRGKNQGHFFIVEIYKKLTQCDIEIAQQLGELLSAATYENHNYLRIDKYYHENFMIDILENTLTEEKLIRHQLAPLGWDPEDPYCIFLLYVPKDGETLKRYMMADFAEGFDARAFLYKEYLVVLYRDAKPERLAASLKKKTKTFQRTGGLSENFRKFSHMSYYYCQAAAAIEEGGKRHPKEYLFFYKDYFAVHLGKLCSRKIPCYLPVQLLYRHDCENHTQYCLTLFTYLQNERNAVKTAESLYIHRNTLKYRLAKIRELISEDLNIPAVRLRILLSLFSIAEDL